MILKNLNRSISIKGNIIPVILVLFLNLLPGFAGTGDTSWMTKGKYGVFIHYQYRILLGYSAGTNPKYPEPSQMTASQWNQFVNGFDVRGFVRQMEMVKAGWVIFCIDDHRFAWQCAPNETFNRYTGYNSGEKCSTRDLIMDLANAFKDTNIKLICYFAGLNGYNLEPKVSSGLADDGDVITPPSLESRKRRIEVLREYCERYKDKIDGWWFDGMNPDSYRNSPYDWAAINSTVHNANPKAVIAFSYGRNEQACLVKGIDDFTGGDVWTGNKILNKQELKNLTPAYLPPENGILWHCKIYCGNIYHGQGDKNEFSDQELADWIKTCNSQGGVCTLDWPLDPKTGLIKDFGFKQMKNISNSIK